MAKFSHIKMPLQPMALLQQTFLHKLPKAVGKKFTTPIHHGDHVAAIKQHLPQTSFFGVFSG